MAEQQDVQSVFIRNISSAGFQPYALCSGKNNTLFVAGTGYVCQFDVDKGTVIGKFGEKDGLGSIRGIAASYALDEVFVSDTDHHRILRYDLKSFQKKGVIGDDSILYFPCGLAVIESDDTEVWALNRDKHQLEIFHLDGTHKRSISGKGEEVGKIRRPECIIHQPEVYEHTVLLADWGNNRMQLIKTDSEDQFEAVTADDTTFDRLRSAVFLNKDVIAAIDFGASVVKILKRKGQIWKMVGTVGSKGGKDGQFRFPVWLAWDSICNSLFVTDTGNGRICQFNIHTSDV